MRQIALLVFFLFFILQNTLDAQEPAEAKIASDTTNRTDTRGNKIGYWEEKQGEITLYGTYDLNKKTGNWVSYYPNKMIAGIAHFKDGVKDGISVQFDRRGKILEISNYKGGKLHGQTLGYTQTGDLPASEIFFANGKKDGIYRISYDNGKIQEESFYKNDKKNGTCKWYNKSGHLVAEYNYKEGNFDGTQKTYYDTDTLQSIKSYSNNQLSGIYKDFYSDGKVRESGNYINGNKDGVWNEYDESGKLAKTTKYKAGKTK